MGPPPWRQLSYHDLTTARADQVFYWARKVGLEIVADKGYTGAGPGVTVPFKGKWDNLTGAQRQHNRVVNSTRALVERGFTQLKTWTVFRRSHCCPTFLGQAGKAILALELNHQHRPASIANRDGTSSITSSRVR